MHNGLKSLICLGLLATMSVSFAGPHSKQAPACAPTTQEAPNAECNQVVLTGSDDSCYNYYVPTSARSKNTQMMQKCKPNKQHNKDSSVPPCTHSDSKCQIKKKQ